MATGILALLDDISTILDDVSLLAKVAAQKTTGVVGDDLALNAQQVAGVRAERELPVVFAVAPVVVSATMMALARRPNLRRNVTIATVILFLVVFQALPLGGIGVYMLFPFGGLMWATMQARKAEVAAQIDRLADFLEQDVAIEDVGVGVVDLAIEGAEVADRGAGVGVVDVAVDVVGAIRLGVQPPRDGIGRLADRGQIVGFEQCEAIRTVQPLSGDGLVQHA